MRRRKSSASSTSRSVARTRRDGRRARLARQQRHLAEEIAFLEPHACRRPRSHLHAAAGDQVHGIAAVALADDGGAGRHRARAQHADEVGDRGGVEAREQRHARHHGEGDDEVAAADLLVEAAADDGDGQREAADAQHDGDGGDDAAERGDRRELAAADLGQHRGRPPHRLGHVAELVGLHGGPRPHAWRRRPPAARPSKMMTQASSARRSAAIRRPIVASAGE